jgi:Flp pilus assembly protein protease CpaA
MPKVILIFLIVALVSLNKLKSTHNLQVNFFVLMVDPLLHLLQVLKLSRVGAGDAKQLTYAILRKLVH